MLDLTISKLEKVVFLNQDVIPSDPGELEILNDVVAAYISDEMGSEYLLWSDWERVYEGFECYFVDASLCD